jgi:TolB-like protein
VTAGLAALVAFVALGAWAAAHGDEPALAEERVVVAPFVNLTGDPEFDALGRMAAEWVTQGLSEARLGEPVPTETAVASARHADSAVARAGGDRMQLLARETRAALVVTGAIYRTGDSVALHAQITDARHGRVVRALDPVVAPAAAPAPAVAELAGGCSAPRTAVSTCGSTSGSMGGIARSAVDGAPPELRAVPRGAPSAACRLRQPRRGGDARAPAALRTRSYNRVRPAGAPDGEHVRQHGALGRRRLAPAAAQRAPVRLTPFEAATADVLRTWVASDLGAAYAAARRAAALEPGGAMTMQVALVAIRLTGRARRSPCCGRSTDRGDGARRAVLLDLPGRRAPRARRATTTSSRPSVRARAPFPQHDGYLLLSRRGRWPRSGARRRPLVQVDARLALPPGRGFGLPTQLLHTSAELARHGHPDAARATAARLLAWMDARGPGAFDARRWELFRARTLLALGRDREAAVRLAALVAADSTVDDPLFYLGVAAARLGDRTTAARMSARLAALPGRDSMYFDYARAAIAAQLGDRAAALALLRQAFVRGLAVANGRLHADPPFDPLRGDPAFEALVRPKP